MLNDSTYDFCNWQHQQRLMGMGIQQRRATPDMVKCNGLLVCGEICMAKDILKFQGNFRNLRKQARLPEDHTLVPAVTEGTLRLKRQGSRLAGSWWRSAANYKYFTSVQVELTPFKPMSQCAYSRKVEVGH